MIRIWLLWNEMWLEICSWASVSRLGLGKMGRIERCRKVLDTVQLWVICFKMGWVLGRGFGGLWGSQKEFW